MNRRIDQAVKLTRLQNRILARKGLVSCGSEFTVALHSRGKVVYAGADRWGQGDCTRWEHVSSVSCTSDRVTALMQDGTLRTAGLIPADASLTELSHVRSVACCRGLTAALLGNGRVVVGGNSRRTAAFDTSEWPTVTDVVCGKDCTLGLTPTGRVVVAGGSHHLRHALEAWENIAGLFTDYEGETVFGITVDGRLLSTGTIPRNAQNWRNLIFLAAAGGHIWGVTATGLLCTTAPARMLGDLGRGEHYVACSASPRHTAAVTRDGLVLASGDNTFGQCRTLRFGALFAGFEEFSAERREVNARTATGARTYHVRFNEASRYKSRMVCGERLTACLTADGRVLTSVGFCETKQWTKVRALACGNAHLVALREDGDVLADGNDTEGCTAVSEWQRVKAIAARKYHTLGVTEDGRVLFCGRNDKGQGNVTAWSGIRRIYAADDYTVGLGYDGVLYIAGQPPFDSGVVGTAWNHPVDVAVTATHMVALYENGTVLSTRMIPESESSGDGAVWETRNWHNICGIAAGEGFTVGLCYGGRVVATGDNRRGQCEVSEWVDVVAVACGRSYTVGLTSDGRVLSAGCQRREFSTSEPFSALEHRGLTIYAPPETETWRDVVALTAGPEHTVAMNREGQVLATGLDSDGQCTATTHFSLFRDVRQLYGYGKHRKLWEAEDSSIEENEDFEVSREDVVALLPFAQFAAHLRADAEALAARLAGDDDQLTILDENGNSVTYCYETATSATSSGSRMVKTSGRDSDTNCVETGQGGVSRVTSGRHTVTLFADGHVEAEGADENGECRTESWSRIIQIAVMPELTLGLRSDGKVMAAGRHHSVLSTLDTVRAIACFGSRRQVFVMADGTLRIHVRGSEFLPEPPGDLRLFTPSAKYSILNRHTFRGCSASTARAVLNSFDVGMAHTVFLRKSGEVVTEGNNDCGQCDVRNCGTAIQVSAGSYHSATILANGTAVLTGRNNYGQSDMAALNRELKVVGTLVEESRHSAVPTVSSVDPWDLPFAWKQISCGYNHTVALRSDGRVYALGANPDGRCDTRKWRGIVQVSGGFRHTVACAAGGGCVATGDNRYGQCDVSRWKKVIMIAAGEFHTVGLRADGRVEATGDNRRGQCRVEDLRDIVSVACLPEATLCVRADGRVIIRGGDGELDRSVDALREVVAIHTCEYRIAALTVDRRLILIP